MRNRHALDRKLQALASVPLFYDCKHRELEQIAQLGAIVDVADQATLTTRGRTGREFILLMTGHARCQIDETTVATYGPGDFFGELSVLDGGPRTATITADGEGEILDLTPPIARKLLV